MGRTIRHDEKDGFERSLWSATSLPGRAFPQLSGDQSAEVVIVGGGFTGLSTAYQLAKRGVDVVVLEGKVPGFGASGRNNGGAVQDFALATPAAVAARFGAGRAAKIMQVVDTSVERLRELVSELDDDCDLTLTGFLDVAHRPGRVEFLRKRFDNLIARGLSARWLSGEECAAESGSPIYNHGGYLLDRAGHVHPLKVARALARAVDARGGRIFCHSPAISTAPAEGGWRVRTEQGSIRADKMILAQNAYADTLWPGLHGATIHMQPWLCATKPLPPDIAATVIPGDYLLGDSHPAPCFFRKNKEGRLSSAVMRGIRLAGGKPDLRRMVALVRRTFPQVRDVEFEFAWQGLATFHPGELPQIVSLADNAWAAFGFGRGVTMTHVMGALLADIACGGDPAGAVLPVCQLGKIRFGGLVDRLLPSVLRLANARG